MEDIHPLRQWRTDKGLKQAAAAAELGITPPELSRFEKGRRRPKLELAVKLSEQTGISIDKFVKQSVAAE